METTYLSLLFFKKAVEKIIPKVRGRVAVIPNGVDLYRNQFQSKPPLPNSLVFNGALTYYANYEAMQFFIGQILPLILKQVPEVNLSITGSTVNVDFDSFVVNKNIVLTGYLDDIRPVVSNAWACVVPLREGGGTRLKILEAMALGTPVISTSKGAEGLTVTHNENILIADDPIEFARQTVRLVQNTDLRSRLAINARRLVESKYGWDTIGKQFVKLVETCSNIDG